jgi:DNA topoisomerase-6 subunit B
VQQEGERRNIFLRYLREVAAAVSQLNGTPADALYDQLLRVAKRKTSDADVRLDERGRPVEESDDFGDGVLIVNPEAETATADAAEKEEPAA